MLKLLFAVLALIVLAMVAGAYLQFDPSWPILGILAFGIFMVGRIGDVPPLPPGGKPTHWGGGPVSRFRSSPLLAAPFERTSESKGTLASI